MITSFCFVTRDQCVTNNDIKKVKIELVKNNFEVVEQTRLGMDGVVLRVQNFLAVAPGSPLIVIIKEF